MHLSSLKDKNLIMLVAPSAMGKSTIIDEVLSLDKRFSRVRGFTTRSPRIDDRPDQFFYISQQQLSLKRYSSEIVTEVVFEQTGDTYGTILESYRSEYCVLETLASSVNDYSALPFKSTAVIAIASPANIWQSRFTNRYPEPSQSAENRLQEAVESINWSINYSDKRWLINDRSSRAVASELISLTDDQHRAGRDGSQHSRDILNLIERGVWNEKISNI